MNYRQLTSALVPLYGRGEAQTIARIVYEEVFGLSLADVLLGRDEQLTLDERSKLENIASQLLKGTPVQHVLGYADFCGHRFCVGPDVLIPRPETERLVELCVDFCRRRMSCRVLDLGTGSGCIAVALALALPAAHVVGVDVSAAALRVARDNASRLCGGGVAFLHHDMLRVESLVAALRGVSAAAGSPCGGVAPAFDVIVSNPPYIRRSEAASMHANVVDHEPHIALFVPDDDALLFYRAIAATAAACLAPGGIVAVEVNASLAGATAALFSDMGFSARVVKDVFGRERFVVASQGHDDAHEAAHAAQDGAAAHLPQGVLAQQHAACGHEAREQYAQAQPPDGVE